MWSCRIEPTSRAIGDLGLSGRPQGRPLPNRRTSGVVEPLVGAAILANLRTSRSAATHRSVAKELLHVGVAVYFADLQVALRIHTDLVRPVELTKPTAARADPIDFLQCLPIDRVDR